MKYILLLISILYLASCATTDSTIPQNSLGGNSSIPDKEIIQFYGRKQWNEMRRIPYDGYVIIRGSINRNKEVVFSKIEESFPDGRRNSMALEYAKGIPSESCNPGSRLKPRINVYVVFYETNSSPNRALVFTKKEGDAAPGETFGGSTYMRMWTY